MGVCVFITMHVSSVDCLRVFTFLDRMHSTLRLAADLVPSICPLYIRRDEHLRGTRVWHAHVNYRLEHLSTTQRLERGAGIDGIDHGSMSLKHLSTTQQCMNTTSQDAKTKQRQQKVIQAYKRLHIKRRP